VLKDIAYLLLALPSSHRHELSGKRNWFDEWGSKMSSEAACTASGDSAGEKGTVDAAMLWGAGIVDFVHRIQMAIVGADWFDDNYDYSQKKTIMVLLEKRDVYIGLRQL
jgi:hypothetical protein